MLKKEAPGYTSWQSMKARCNYPYGPYHAKGIKICHQWQKDFWQFYEDMGPRPEGMTIDRIDNDGDYTPENCRWASVADQQVKRATPKNNKSGYRGVSYRKSTGKWRANICYKGGKTEIGNFDTAKEAAIAYNIAARELHGPIAQLNDV